MLFAVQQGGNYTSAVFYARRGISEHSLITPRILRQLKSGILVPRLTVTFPAMPTPRRIS